MKISFFIPTEQWPTDINRDAPVYRWSDERFGKWNWTLQTFQHLCDHGVACQTTTNLEENGIVFAHRSVLPDHYHPTGDQLLVSIQAERVRHPFAQFHLLQDPAQAAAFSSTVHSWIDRRLLGSSSRYIRYWPQPGLIPRDPERGDRFETIAFKGMPQQLAKELQRKSFRTRLQSMGLRWIAQHKKSSWPDYSQIDAVLAVRTFCPPRFNRKPATKLYNAWLAGVPALLGPETAFRYEGNAGVDYLEVHSVDETVERLSHLKTDLALRRQIVQAGVKKAESFTIQRLVDDWQDLIDRHLNPLYERWRMMSHFQRQRFFDARSATFASRRLPRRIRPWFDPFL